MKNEEAVPFRRADTAETEERWEEYMKRKIPVYLILLLLCSLLFSTAVKAYPAECNVITVWPEGWKFYYQDGTTSAGAYPTVAETGEILFCVQPHFDATSGPRDRWLSLPEYFGEDKTFANKLALTAYFSLNSGWGEDGIAVGQSLIWKYITERENEAGEQWLATAKIVTREQMQAYYDQVEQKVQDYLEIPDFHGTEVVLEAGSSVTLTDKNGALKDMEISRVSGPVQVSKEGNDLTITAEGTAAAEASVQLTKPLPNGAGGSNFVYYSESYQDVMTQGFYEPVQSSLAVKILQAKTDVEISKQELTTGKEIPGASLTVTDQNGNEIDSWISEETPHLITGLLVGESYVLTERLPAPGYVLAQSISFTAMSEIEPVVMKDDVTKVAISKVDAETGEGLPGACLQVLDKEGQVIGEWVSDGGPYRIEKLVAGERYILREKKAPEGYLLAEAVEFLVQDTGEVQEVFMKNEKEPEPSEEPTVPEPTEPTEETKSIERRMPPEETTAYEKPQTEEVSTGDGSVWLPAAVALGSSACCLWGIYRKRRKDQ